MGILKVQNIKNMVLLTSSLTHKLYILYQRQLYLCPFLVDLSSEDIVGVELPSSSDGGVGSEGGAGRFFLIFDLVTR